MATEYDNNNGKRKNGNSDSSPNFPYNILSQEQLIFFSGLFLHTMRHVWMGILNQLQYVMGK